MDRVSCPAQERGAAEALNHRGTEAQSGKAATKEDGRWKMEDGKDSLRTQTELTCAEKICAAGKELEAVAGKQRPEPRNIRKTRKAKCSSCNSRLRRDSPLREVCRGGRDFWRSSGRLFERKSWGEESTGLAGWEAGTAQTAHKSLGRRLA